MTTVEMYVNIKSLILKMGPPAARWCRFLWRILAFSLADERVVPLQGLSVVLEHGRVSVVYASRFLSRISIRGVRSYAFEKGKYPTPENVVSAVSLAMNDLHITRAQVILVIPKSWTIVKTTDFPLSVTDSLSNVISYELDRLTPLSADRAFYDFQTISSDENRIYVMVAAVNSDLLGPYIEALKENKIPARRIAVSSSAFGTLSDYAHGSGTVVFVVVRGDGYEGGLISDRKWCTSFAGKIPSEDGHACLHAVAGEVNPLIERIKNEKGNAEVIIDMPLSEKWRPLFRDVIHAPVLFIAEMDLNLRFANNSDWKEAPYIALGGALEHLWPGASKMNLLAQGCHKRSKTPMALTVILLSIFLALGLFWVASPLQIEEWKVEAMDREIAARKDEVRKVEILKKDLQNVEKELSAIRTFKSSRPMAMVLLKEITRILPENAWLSRLRVVDSAIETEGYAASATEIVPKLEASKYFKKVEFASSTNRDPRTNLDHFIIKMEIEGLPEDKVEYEKKQ